MNKKATLLSERAVNVSLPLKTTFQCKIGFSAMTAIEIKHSNSLSVSDDLRLCLSQNPPVDKLVSNMHAHQSH